MVLWGMDIGPIYDLTNVLNKELTFNIKLL